MSLEEIRENRKLKVSRIKKYLNLLMSVIYISMAVLLYTTKIESLSDNTRIIVASVLLVYGLFRLYRGIKYEN